MTDHKFTDDEVIKALECCAKLDFSFEECEKCPYKSGCGAKNNMPEDALALINRQNAEIERLNAVYADMTESLRLASEANKDMVVELQAMRGAANSYKMHHETAKAEAIKEFASRLRRKAYMPFMFAERIGMWVAIEDINEIEKEMTEELK